MTYLLDTHIWIWMNAAPEKLPESHKKLLTGLEEHDKILLSAVSIWEVCKLVEEKRVTLFEDTEAWLKRALDIPGLRLVPLDERVFLKSTTLPQPFHNDPADQMIVASARIYDATILTHDRLILDYEHVKTL